MEQRPPPRRIKRPEHGKEYRPEALGAILGLDRAPEVKRVRRKFTRLAALGRGQRLMDALARQRIAEDPDRVAFLDVDGHVREYHGKFPLFEAKKAQRQVVPPAATDTWVEVARLQSELGKEAAANHEATRPTMRGFKIAHAGLREQLQKAEARIQRLLEQRKKTPKRIPASDLKALKTEKKLIADAIQMAAYQVETELLAMLQDHYRRADEEGRTLLHAAFQSSARLEIVEGELRVTIGRQSSPHRTAALAALCEQLDALAVTFPGTHLRLRLAVQALEPVIS